MSTNSHDNTVPVGYWQGAKGALIPDAMVNTLIRSATHWLKILWRVPGRCMRH